MKTYEVTFYTKYTIELDDDSTEEDALDEAEAKLNADYDSGWFTLDNKVFPLD